MSFLRVLYPHTAECLADHLQRGLADMGVLEKLWTITADNASTNPAMMDKLKVLLNCERVLDLQDECLIRCIAHVLQLAIKEALKAVPPLDVAIGHMRDLAKKFQDSPKLTEALERISRELNHSYQALQLDVETRWNSTWEMVQVFIKMRDPVSEVLRRIWSGMSGYSDFCIKPSDELAQPISDIFWSALTSYRDFLRVFRESTVVMSASKYPTLSMTVPVFCGLVRAATVAVNASQGFTSTHASTFAATVLSKLHEYEPKVVTSVTVVASLLDPRSKHLIAKFTNLTRNEQMQYLIDAYVLGDFDHTDSFSRSDGDSSEAAGSESTSSVFLRMFREAEQRSRQSASESIEDEVKRWMDLQQPMKIDQPASDVLLYWKTNQMFPRLKPVARRYLAVTASSVPSEIAFSSAGGIVFKRRSRLSDESVEMLVELQSLDSFLSKL